MTLQLVTLLPLPQIDSLVQETLLPLLQVYRQVFVNRSRVLSIIRHLSQDNVCWERIFHPLLTRSGTYNNYLNKEILSCFSEFVSFSFEASRLNQSPKGCAILNQLENNLKQLIKEKMSNQRSDIFDILQKVLEKTQRHEVEQSFVAEILRENINFEIVSRTEPFLSSPHMLYCYIAVHTSQELRQRVRDYLTFLILSPEHGIKCKKSVVLNVVKSEGLRDLVFLVFDQFLEKMTAEFSDLSRYSLCLLIRNQEGTLSSPQMLNKSSSVLLKQLQLYCDRSDLVSDRALRSICEFSKVYLSTVPIDQVTAEILDHFIKIAQLRMEVDDFLRSSCLCVVSSCLPRLPSLKNVSDVLQKLCSIAIEPSCLVSVRDSALQCVTAMVDNTTISHSLSEQDHQLVLLVVDRSLNSNSSQLKASAISLVSALFDKKRPSHLQLLERIFPSEDVDGLEFCDLFSADERLEMVGLASRVVRDMEEEEEEEGEEEDVVRIVQFIIKTVDCDTNWEVKCKSLEYWRTVHSVALVRHSSNAEEMRKFLEKFQFYTGLLLGYRDYEDSVRCRYFHFIKSLHGLADTAESHSDRMDTDCKAEVVNAPSRTSDTDSNLENEEEINRILDATDNKLVQMMNKRPPVDKDKTEKRKATNFSYGEFKLIMKNISDPTSVVSAECELESILDDILQSCSEDCQLDLIDCY